MGDLTTTREALVAEALGEVDRVAHRLESVVPAVDASREALTQASAKLSDQLSSFEVRMTAIAENAKGVAIRHIAQRTDELARSTGEAQVRAMHSAAISLFRDELRPALQGLAASLQQPSRLQRVERWLTHAAVAILASALSWAMAAWLWAR
jgi:hypothetical protein